MRMVGIFDIIRDEAITDDRSLDELGLSRDEVVETLDARAGLVVGVPHEPALRIEYYRECMGIALAAQFGQPWTVGRLRSALRRVDENAYPET